MSDEARELREIRDIFDLVPDDRNANKGTERGLAALDSSLSEFGAGRSILADRDGRIIAGNKTLDRAADQGFPVRVVDSDGTELIVVRRTDLTLDDPRARGLAIADNRVGQLDLEWDPDVLRSFESDGLDLTSLGFTPDEFLALTNPDPDPADETRARATVPVPALAQAAPYSDDAITADAFAYYRERGFPFRSLSLHQCKLQINKLARTADETLLRTATAYQVADTYHPHRMRAAATGMRAPYDSFMDDKLLKKALAQELEYFGTIRDNGISSLNLVSGTQACANFRPGFALYYYRRYLPLGGTLLDPCTGYGGRLVAFAASNLAGRYIGIDPNVPTHEANTRMARDLGLADCVTLLNLPAEDVDPAPLANTADFAFTSPPYFAKERYSDAPTQSWVRYQTGDEWREGFLSPLLTLVATALKPGKTAAINIADVTIGSKTYPLAAWTVQCAQRAGLRYVRTDEFEQPRGFGANLDDIDDRTAVEPVLIFEKPADDPDDPDDPDDIPF